MFAEAFVLIEAEFKNISRGDPKISYPELPALVDLARWGASMGWITPLIAT